MALTLLAVTVRSSTRIRLVFDRALAAGAFNASLYKIWDNTLGVPGVTLKAALAVAGQTAQAELVCSTPLTEDDSILVTCSTVPAADASTYTGQMSAYWGANVIYTPNVEPTQNNGSELAFGTDLVHNGNDYVEDATADLALVSGIQNVMTAIPRRVRSYSLPWDQSYGARLEDYVDGPNASAAPAAGLIKRQVLSDDRTTSCTVTLEEDDTVAGGAFFRITPILKTNRKLPPFDIAIAELYSTGE